MEIYLTNLGKYNEGYLVGEWVHLPVSDDDLRAVFDRIGINKEYEEFFITDYENSPICINEYDSIEQLNILAEKIESLSDVDNLILEYLINYESLNICEAIEEFDEGNYCYYWDVMDELDLGYRVSEDWDIPEHLASYIDYEAIGRDYTCSGWVLFENIALCRYQGLLAPLQEVLILKIALIQDKYNNNKIWIIKKYKNRNVYYNQKIGDRVIYNFSRTSKKFLKSLFEDNEKALEVIEKF